MKVALKTSLAALATAALAAGTALAFAGGGAGAAAAAPPWEPDPNAMGTITFYNSSGSVITGGSLDDTPFATYASGSVLRAGDQTAALFFFLPNPSATPDNWSGDQLSGFNSYPVASGPANIKSLNQPVATSTNQDLPLNFFVSEFPNGSAQQSNTAYQNLYQVRLKSADSTGLQTTKYDDADIMVNTATNTWQQVYPTPAATKVSTAVAAISATPASPAKHGSSVSLTSTVTAADSSHPAGVVELFDGATDLGAATFTASTGAVTKTLTPADGTHSYKLVFTPTDSAGYATSTSAVLSYAVAPVTSTTTTLAIAPTGPVQVGTATTLTATVSPSTAAGTVQFFDGASPLGTASVASGSASLTTSSLTVGTHSLKAVFTATDPNQFANSSSATASYIIEPVPATTTTTSISVSPTGPVDYASTVTLVGTVTPSDAAGAIQFYDGTATLGSPVPVTAGSATLATTTLSSGPHQLTAAFVPTNYADFGSSRSSSAALTVNPQVTTTTLSVAPPSPQTRGSAVTLTATISPTSATGTVQFRDGSAGLGSPVTVAAGKATLTTTALSVGTHSLTAVFTPTDSAAYSQSTSDPASYTVNPPPPGATSTALGVAPTGPIIVGHTVTLTATVTPAVAGSVTFFDGTASLGSPVTVTSGKASYTDSPAVGDHSYTAKFTPADPTTSLPSTSAAHSVHVDPVPTATSVVITATPDSPVDFGAQVSLKATITPAGTAGAVSFLDGKTVLATVPVVDDAAMYATSSLASGDHDLTARFTPSDTVGFATSTSASVTVTVKQPPTVTGTTVNGKPIDSGVELSPGTTVTLTASGFQPGEVVHISVHSTPIDVGTATADSSGRVTATVTIPSELAAGNHTIVLAGQLASASFAFKVAATTPTSSAPPQPVTSTPAAPAAGSTVTPVSGASTSSGLALTGSNSVLGLGLAFVLLALGSATVLLSKRRTRPARR